MTENRIAIVTGASSGIGKATARTLAAHGVAVLATGRDERRLALLARELTSEGWQAGALAGEAGEPGLVDRLFDACEQQWGRPADMFVLAAGQGMPGTLLGSDPDRWHRMIEVNYVAALHQLRECAVRFVREATNGDGTRVYDIVAMGSTVGRQISALNPVYGSTKFALHSIVEALRQEVCGSGVRVTLVEPGFVKTAFQRNARYDLRWFQSVEDEQGPLLSADDIARVVDFVVHQPPSVHVDNVRVRPTRQRV